MLIKRDILKTKELITGDNNDENYSKIYIRTNEDLENLFKCFSVKDKNVLTVLSSSDQMFCSYYMGARNVDTFDLNKLTKYYYYLRKWLMEYKNKFSPSNTDVERSNEWLYELLKVVECKSYAEEVAYGYWLGYTKITPEYLTKALFNLNSDINRTMITDLKKLRGIIRDKELSFKCQDICGEIDKSHKYNTIILSNILEYISCEKEKLEACCDNLYDILEEDGEVICTNLIDYYPSNLELAVFADKFEIEDLGMSRKIYKVKKKGKDLKLPLGYCYHKKRN